MGFESWIKLLYTYGPFALLVFFVFVAERKARTALKETSEASLGTRRTLLGIYGATWGAIFGLVVFAMIVWYQINLPSETSMYGTFGKLEGSETVASDTDKLFLHRNYEDGKGRFHYEWRLITPRKLPDSAKVRLTFDRSQPQSEWVRDYELTVRSSFYDSEVRLVFDREHEKLLLKHDGKEEELVPLNKLAAVDSRQARSFLIGTAYAQGPFSASEFTKRLESNDPIIRRDARKDLAAQGQAALPWIQAVLTDGQSSYRLRLGIIVAMNQMSDLPTHQLSQAVIDAIADASVHPDPTLRAEASRLLKKIRQPPN